MFRWFVVLAIAIGCGERPRARAPGEVWLASIDVQGNTSIEDDDLIPGLALDRTRRDGERVDPYLLGLDTKRIKYEYTRQGFFDAKVEGKIERKGEREIVIFTVVEGRRARARVFVSDLPPELPEDYVIGKLELEDDAPFDYDLYEDGKDVIKALVEDAGYPYVDLDESVVTVDRETQVAAVSYRVVIAGPRATLGKVTVAGAEEFPALEQAVHGRLAFREGDLYSPQALADTTRALYDLGRFSQVRVEPELENRTVSADAKSATVPVKISVVVVGRHELKLGGGVGYEPLSYEARVRAAFSYIPRALPLWSVGFDGRFAVSSDHAFDNYQPRIRTFLNLRRLELVRPFIVGDLGGGLEFFTTEAYTASGPIARVGLSAPLGVRWLTGQLGWNYSRFGFDDINKFIDEDTQREVGLNQKEINGRFEQSIIADLRDKPLEPRKGAFISLRVIEAGGFAGGRFDYLEIQPDLRGYLPIRTQSSIAFRLRGGAFFGEVPITQRYFSGGAQNHRGFSARTLSPVILGSAPPVPPATEPTVGGVVFGGEAFMETGAELRLAIGELSGFLFGTTIFVDGGDVVNQDAGLDLTNLHWAAGGGIFMKFGGFKIRIDVGRRLNRLNEERFSKTNFFLGVGETY